MQCFTVIKLKTRIVSRNRFFHKRENMPGRSESYINPNVIISRTKLRLELWAGQVFGRATSSEYKSNSKRWERPDATGAGHGSSRNR